MRDMTHVVYLLTHFDNMCKYRPMIKTNDKELRIIKFLASNGKSLVGTISKLTLLNRTSLYHTLNSLSEKGLVTRSTFNKSTYYELNPLDQIDLLMKKDIDEQINEKDSLLSEIKRSLKTTQESLLTDIKHYEGQKGVEQCYYDSVYQNKGKQIYTLTDYDAAYHKLKLFLEQEYFPARIKNNIRVNSIAPTHSHSATVDIKRNKSLLRDVKFANLFANSNIELSVYDDKVSIVYFDAKKPAGIILKNAVIAKAFKEIFNFIWKQSK